jgi:hypothetical protein
VTMLAAAPGVLVLGREEAARPDPPAGPGQAAEGGHGGAPGGRWKGPGHLSPAAQDSGRGGKAQHQVGPFHLSGTRPASVGRRGRHRLFGMVAALQTSLDCSPLSLPTGGCRGVEGTQPR